MTGEKERRDSSLESRAVAAHRAYIAALRKWERAFHAANRSDRCAEGAADLERTLRCAAAEAEKERLRVVFRDLCDALGYVPGGHGVALPAADCTSGAG